MKQLTLEEIKERLGYDFELVKEKPTASYFDRAEICEAYYYIDDCGSISFEKETICSTNEIHYRIGNYCTNFEIMQQHALERELDDLLWRFSMQNGRDTPTFLIQNLNITFIAIITIRIF